MPANMGSSGHQSSVRNFEAWMRRMERWNRQLDARIAARGGSAGSAGEGLPIGTVAMWTGTTPPDGWLVADGSALSRTDYADLFNIIGTTWGSGDGSTTFNIPDFRNKMPRGNTQGAGGGSDTHVHNLGTAGWARLRISPTDNVIAAYYITAPAYATNAQNNLGGSPSGGGTNRQNAAALGGQTNSASNLPAYTGVTFIIKYAAGTPDTPDIGPPGPPGPAGPAGPPGPPGNSFVQTINQPAVGTSYSVPHNLNTLHPIVQLWDAITGIFLQSEIRIVDANTVNVTFWVQPPNNVNVVVTAGLPPSTEGAAAGFFRYYQSAAATVWTIAHNLGFRPSVFVVDSTYSQIYPGDLNYQDDNTVVLTFSAAVGGEAYLS